MSKKRLVRQKQKFVVVFVKEDEYSSRNARMWANGGSMLADGGGHSLIYD